MMAKFEHAIQTKLIWIRMEHGKVEEIIILFCSSSGDFGFAYFAFYLFSSHT